LKDNWRQFFPALPLLITSVRLLTNSVELQYIAKVHSSVGELGTWQTLIEGNGILGLQYIAKTHSSVGELGTWQTLFEGNEAP
jgi:hypothetical protein